MSEELTYGDLYQKLRRLEIDVVENGYILVVRKELLVCDAGQERELQESYVYTTVEELMGAIPEVLIKERCRLAHLEEEDVHE